MLESVNPTAAVLPTSLDAYVLAVTSRIRRVDVSQGVTAVLLQAARAHEAIRWGALLPPPDRSRSLTAPLIDS